jgi:type III secretion protein R
MPFDPVWLIVVSATLGLLPLFLIMATSYVKIVVVLMLVRNALGVQQIPPQMVINALAMIMSIFIMAPVGSDMMDRLNREQNLQSLQPMELF